MSRRARVACLVALLAGCGGPTHATSGPNKVEIPTTDGMGPVAGAKTRAHREGPPPSGTAKEAPFPAVSRSKLPNGMGLAVVTSRALPIVQVRLLVHVGEGFGPAPGVAELTAEMLKDGGTRAMSSAEVLRRVETLGSNLSVHTDLDSTVLGMAVTKDQLGDALSLLSQVVREPRFDAAELRKLKARAIDEVEDAARSSGSWTAKWLAMRELFGDKHPYGTYAALPSMVAKVDGAQIRELYRRFYVPKAATLVLAGDVDEALAKQLADRNFGGWAGGEPPKVELAPPTAPRGKRVFVAHRPKSVQSDVFVVGLAPPRRTPGQGKEAEARDWAHVRVANHVLGGGVASRLFSDVREQRSLAYRTSSQILELSHGEQPLLLYAGTQTSKTTDALEGLLENVQKMRTAPPTAQETETARRYLADVFAIRMETIGSIADMVVTEDELGLPPGYWDAYRKELRATEAPAADAAAAKLFDDSKVFVVVAGDADAIGPALTKWGEVTIVDPEKEFHVLKTLPAGGK